MGIHVQTDHLCKATLQPLRIKIDKGKSVAQTNLFACFCLSTLSRQGGWRRATPSPDASPGTGTNPALRLDHVRKRRGMYLMGGTK